MISLERAVYAQAKSGQMSLDALADYLMKHYPVYEIALSLAETVQYEPTKPIVISEEEFRTHFRIRGKRGDGQEVELRGRPRKDSTI